LIFLFIVEQIVFKQLNFNTFKAGMVSA